MRKERVRCKHWRGLINKPKPEFLYKRPPKGKNRSIFKYFFGLFSIYLAPSGAKYCEKRVGPLQKGLETHFGTWETHFGTFWIFGIFMKFQAVIKSAASAASRKTKNQGPIDPGEPTDDGSACGRRGSAGPPWILVPDSWSSWRLR